MFRRIGAIVFLAISAIAVGPLSAQQDPGFLELAYLAETDPEAALTRIDELIAQTGAAGEPDQRMVFDLYRLQVELLKRLARQEEAAALLVELAAFATRNRETLEIDPTPLFSEAVTLFTASENYDGALIAAEGLLEEHRNGARPATVIADTLQLLESLATDAGDAVLAGRYARARVAALDAGDSSTRGADRGFREVEIFYATDRARSGNSEPAAFYGAGRGALELGVATVTIPNQHVPGVLEAPSIWRLEFRANPARHVVLQSIEPMEVDAYFGRMKGKLTQTPEREVFVFIHGYNVSFDQAARRAAQIAFDMNYVGVPVLYSWPSSASTVGYVSDTAVVRLSGRRLSRFLEDLVARSGADTIHIVAHSMGNRALTDALELMALRHDLKPGDTPLFGQILFAAPDVDAGLFREMLPTIRPIARRLTLYASEEDWALAASRKLHGNMPRAGIGGKLALTDPNIDSIDMSELGEDMLSHSYFADDSSALADILTLFWQNTSPRRRCGLFSDRRDGSPIPVWAYRRGVCDDRSLIGVLAHLRRSGVSTPEGAKDVVRQTVEDEELARKLETVVSAIVTR